MPTIPAGAEAAVLATGPLTVALLLVVAARAKQRAFQTFADADPPVVVVHDGDSVPADPAELTSVISVRLFVPDVVTRLSWLKPVLRPLVPLIAGSVASTTIATEPAWIVMLAVVCGLAAVPWPTTVEPSCPETPSYFSYVTASAAEPEERPTVMVSTPAVNAVVMIENHAMADAALPEVVPSSLPSSVQALPPVSVIVGDTAVVPPIRAEITTHSPIDAPVVSDCAPVVLLAVVDE
jgi:hypothetical protein